MTKISALSDIGTSVASNDTFVLVDVSDPTTPNKKIQQQNILAAGGLLPDGSAGTPGLRFTSDTNVGLFRPTTDTLGFATGGSERLRIDSSGRVGIGTSSPSTPLHVFGNSRVTSIGSNASKFQLQNAVDGTDVSPTFRKIEFLDSNGGEAGNITSVNKRNGFFASEITFSTRSSANVLAERVRIDSSGRVGIGTQSPGRLLTLNDSGNAGILSFTGGTSSVQSILFGDTGSETRGKIVYNHADDSLSFTVTDSERARIDSSGRLLVGTSSAPSGIDTTLVLSGNSSSSTANPTILFARNNFPNPGLNADLGRIGFGNANYAGAQITGHGDGAWTSGTSHPTRLVFSVTADGAASPTEALRISSNRAITVSDGGHIVLGTGTGTKIGTSTSQKIGFFDETPIVQPTTGIAEAAFVENSGGTAVNVDSTFGGYTIQQVVQALQNLGLLA